MSLASRLEQVRIEQALRERGRVGEDPGLMGRGGAPGIAVRKRGPRNVDPFADLKRQVHQALLDTLGPKLYDARLTPSEMEQKVRQTLQEVLASGETPLTGADRARVSQEISDDILGYGPIEPYLRDIDITEIMVN